MVTCHDCGMSDKTISMRQCDWLLCNQCQASRATRVIRERGSYVRGATAKTPIKTTSATDAKKTTSGQRQVAETPPSPPLPLPLHLPHLIETQKATLHQCQCLAIEHLVSSEKET